MARKNVKIETPGQEAPQDDDSDLIGGDAGAGITDPANTEQELHAATAGATVSEQTVKQRVAKLLDDAALKERNAALSDLNAQGFAVITKFEAYGFTDEHGHPLTNSLEFIALVTTATTSQAAPAVVTSEDGARKNPGKPVLTEHGWHVPG
ncbi:hypothetical protein [Serratia proteamaculans]|uniref:Uncharacterized protein n=1 Tax=Serratia proteamaculans TaxID=28151 RepID=A0A5Q2VE90_SERPR|nr:hypothetical protein [Serratia proteamaculans]QGH62728.1 hypothetical protein GHV41_18715 [Serratia proteamaculans]